jgi:hypothetical protein
MGTPDNNHVDPRFKHLMDPVNYRRDGRERKGFGKFLKQHGPAIGRTALQIGRGVVDGIPGVSQVVNTLLPQKHVTPAQAGTRILVGWATVAIVGGIMLMKVTGQIDSWTMLQLLLAVLGM